MIIITHRLAGLEEADQIYVFERGEIVEHGPAEALLRRGGLYAEMYRQQMTG